MVLLFVLTIVILSNAYILGARLFPHLPWMISILPGIILTIALQSITQTGLYYLNQPLGSRSDIIALVVTTAISAALYFFLGRKETTDEEEEEKVAKRPLYQYGIAVALLFVAAIASAWVIRAAGLAGTTESIRTPWPLLPTQTLPLIGVAWAALIASAFFVRSRLATTLHAIIALAPTLSLAALIYRVGYGFDGFLHVASEKIILASGTLSPKPLYYIGQYVFTTWLSRLSHIPIAHIDRWMLPVATAILFPTVIACILPRTRNAAFAFLALAFLPFGAFIATTPQGFAYLLGCCALLLALGTRKQNIHPFAPLIFSAWSIAVHPLAGIPLLFAVFALLAGNIPNRILARACQTIAVILTGASIPLMFFVIGTAGGTSIAWNVGSIFTAAPWLERLASFLPTIGNRFVLWPAWASLADRALPLLLLVLAFLGWKAERAEGEKRSLSPLLLASAATLWIAGTALKATGDFTFLIDYERGNYADRLNTLALLCLLPATVLAIPWIVSHIKKGPRIPLVALACFFLLFATGITYNALPRHDALITGRGWSTSQHDLDAVQLIDRDANGREYTVMANQSVSAGAVSLLGFKRYADDIFFYPIPTGGALYETYLRMTYNEPSRDTVKDAGKLGKTDLVYVVVNNYWWRADSISESIRALADRDWTLGDGKVNVYAFDLSKDSSASTTTSTR